MKITILFKNDNVKIYNFKDELITIAKKRNKFFEIDVWKVLGSEILSHVGYTEISKQEKWHRILLSEHIYSNLQKLNT